MISTCAQLYRGRGREDEGRGGGRRGGWTKEGEGGEGGRVLC